MQTATTTATGRALLLLLLGIIDLTNIIEREVITIVARDRMIVIMIMTDWIQTEGAQIMDACTMTVIIIGTIGIMPTVLVLVGPYPLLLLATTAIGTILFRTATTSIT